MSDKAGTVIIDAKELIDSPFLALGEVGCRIMLKSKGVPLEGVLYPRMMPEYVYYREDMIDGSIKFSWKVAPGHPSQGIKQ